MKENAYEIRNKLEKVDLELLKTIYLHRCLTVRQIYQHFYSDKFNTFNKFLDKKLQELISYKIIEDVDFSKDNVAIFLTKTGIDIVREVFDLPLNIIDSNKNTIKRGYYTASDLKMSSRLIPHQVYLNQFVLDFKRVYEHKKYQMALKYFDEKYVSQYTSIRPDGLLQLLDIDFFLEMDMNTESKAQLIDKWEHYRAFLSSREYHYSEKKKIIVLFIIENTNNIENRKNVIQLTATEILLDKINSNFEIIVGTKDELLKIIFNEIIPNSLQKNYKDEYLLKLLHKKHHFGSGTALHLKNELNNADYEYYIRKLDSENKIAFENGRLQEFLLDFYSSDRLGIINKMTYLSSNSAIFKYHYKRDIDLIVICDDLTCVFNHLKLFNIQNEENIFFTTIERLETMPLHLALCQFDRSGEMYSFKNSGLNFREYNKKERL